MQKTIVENKEVVIGDEVSFKFDVEQEGVIVDFKEKNGEIKAVLKPKGEHFEKMIAREKTVVISLNRCSFPYQYKTILERKELKEKEKTVKFLKLNGKKVFIGDEVWFKMGTEMSGILKDFFIKDGVNNLVLEADSEDGFCDGYLTGDEVVTVEEGYCWICE